MSSFVRRLWARSIRRQLVLGIALVHAAMMTVFVVDLVSRQRTFLHEQSVSNTSSLSQILASNAVSWVLSNDVVGLEEVVDSIAQRPDLAYAMILSPHGKVLGHSDRSLVGLYMSDQVSLGLLDAAPVSRTLVADPWLVDVASPILANGQLVGWARVGVSQDGIRRGLQVVGRDGAAYTLVAIAIGSLIALIMARGLTTGISHLVQVAEQVRLGDGRQRVTLRREDEIGLLGDTLNTMLDTLILQQEKTAAVRSTLRLSEAHLRTLIDTLPDLVWLKDPQGRYLACNHKFERFFGATEAEIVGRTDHDFVAADVAEFFRSHDQAAMDAGCHTMNEEELVYADDGHHEYVETIKTPMVDDEGVLVGVLGVGRDISERRAAEHALVREEARLRVTLQSIGDGVIATDTQQRIVFINRVAEDLTGWRDAEGRGKPYEQVFRLVQTEGEPPRESAASRALSAGRAVVQDEDAVLCSRGGGQLSIRTQASPIRDQDGEVIGVVVVFRDMTQERRLETELIRRKKLESVGVLAGGIAHDFNNILTAIRGNIEVASFDVMEDSETHQMLGDALKATSRAAKLTQQLLTFSKGGDPVMETAALPTLVQESARFVLRGSRVACECHFEHDLWMGQVDTGQISQVIQNIVLNAAQAMAAGGTIQIEGRNVRDADAEALVGLPEGRFICVAIRDTGIGIPKAILDNIFDPYFTTKVQGSGLGLAVCHSIVMKHKGRILVDSIPGEGTTFQIFLPARVSAPATSAAGTQPAPVLRPLRVLVMDDEAMIRELSRRLLAKLGHEALVVEDGQRALEVYKQQVEAGTPPDVVVLDLTVPGGMGGKEAARALLGIDRGARLIVASGYSNDPVMAHHLEHGFCAAVSKPFFLEELRQALASAMLDSDQAPPHA